MKVTRKVLFNHIPKTGGVTLRIILNRVYGPDRVFLIRSTDIKGSLETYKGLPQAMKDSYPVVAGHGAELFRPYMDDPFRVTILREPVELFLSQYYYLRTSKNSSFLEEVSALGSVEEYLDYAVKRGQDNLLTRYLSGSVQFLVNPGLAVPDMRKEGPGMLNMARKAMLDYDAIIDLADFNAGIFALATKLGWDKIPIYRPSNRNPDKPAAVQLSEDFLQRLRVALKYDLELYKTFKDERRGAGLSINSKSIRYRLFSWRQAGIGFATCYVGSKV